MNPLDLPGPDFLGFYTITLAVAVAVAAALRWYLRQPAGEPDSNALQLSAYEVAYLAGGDNLACSAALARLVHDGVMKADSASRRIKVVDRLPSDCIDVERAVHSAANHHIDGGPVATLQSAAARMLHPMRGRLVSAGLVVAPDRAFAALAVPASLIACVLLLGLAKIAVGISRDRPIGFLVVLSFITAGIAIAFAKPVLRTRRGDKALVILKKSNAAMQHALRRHRDDISGNDVVLAVALFGIGTFSGGPMAQLQLALAPPPSSGGGSCGSSSGGSGCGGGCGGGGCGGCGG